MNDLQRLEETIDSCLSECPERGEELVRALMAFYGEGLYRLLEMIHQEIGTGLIDKLGRDSTVSNLLVLHDLHPLSKEERVMEALQSVRPHLGSHGGDVTLLEIGDDRVKLRLEGNCDGCPASQLTLRRLIGEALQKAAPEICDIEVAEPTATPHLKYDSCPTVPVAG